MKKTNKKGSSPLKTVLGPLWNLYSDPKVSEIIVDAFDEVYYAGSEGIKSAQKLFPDRTSLDRTVERLLKFSKGATFFDLEDHTRVNLVLPPMTIKGPSVIIGKIPTRRLTLDDLISFGALSEKGKKLLKSVVAEGFLVAGNMGSGKTTLMNILIDEIPQPNRVVTIERYPDLIIHRAMVCRLKAPHHTPQEMVELVELAERMRADFLVLSECAGPEVMPFLDLVRSHGYGSILLKGESAQDALKFLETKALLSSEGLNLEEVRYSISRTFKHIVFQERGKDGKRRVSTIAKIHYESGALKLEPLDIS